MEIESEEIDFSNIVDKERLKQPDNEDEIDFSNIVDKEILVKNQNTINNDSGFRPFKQTGSNSSKPESDTNTPSFYNNLTEDKNLDVDFRPLKSQPLKYIEKVKINTNDNNPVNSAINKISPLFISMAKDKSLPDVLADKQRNDIYQTLLRNKVVTAEQEKEVQSKLEVLYSNTRNLMLSEEKLRNNPSDINARYSVAYSNSELNNNKQALSEYETIIQQNNGFTAAYTGKAYIWSKVGNNLMAIATMDDAIEANPTSADMYYNRGVYKNIIGDNASALEDYKKAYKFSDESGNSQLKEEASLSLSKMYRTLEGEVSRDKNVAQKYLSMLDGSSDGEENKTIDKEYFKEQADEQYKDYVRIFTENRKNGFENKKKLLEGILPKIQKGEQLTPMEESIWQSPSLGVSELKGLEHSAIVSESLDKLLSPLDYSNVFTRGETEGDITKLPSNILESGKDYLKEGGGVIKQGLVKIGDGFKDVYKGVPRVLVDTKEGFGDVGVGALKVMAGTLESAGGILMNFTPQGIMLQKGLEVGGITVGGEDVAKYFMAPVSEIFQPESEAGKLGAEVVDNILQEILLIGVSGGVPGAKTVAEKLKSKKGLEKTDIPTIVESVSKLDAEDVSDIRDNIVNAGGKDLNSNIDRLEDVYEGLKEDGNTYLRDRITTVIESDSNLKDKLSTIPIDVLEEKLNSSTLKPTFRNIKNALNSDNILSLTNGEVEELSRLENIDSDLLTEEDIIRLNELSKRSDLSKEKSTNELSDLSDGVTKEERNREEEARQLDENREFERSRKDGEELLSDSFYALTDAEKLEEKNKASSESMIDIEGINNTKSNITDETKTGIDNSLTDNIDRLEDVYEGLKEDGNTYLRDRITTVIESDSNLKDKLSTIPIDVLEEKLLEKGNALSADNVKTILNNDNILSLTKEESKELIRLNRKDKDLLTKKEATKIEQLSNRKERYKELSKEKTNDALKQANELTDLSDGLNKEEREVELNQAKVNNSLKDKLIDTVIADVRHIEDKDIALQNASNRIKELQGYKKLEEQGYDMRTIDTSLSEVLKSREPKKEVNSIRINNKVIKAKENLRNKLNAWKEDNQKLGIANTPERIWESAKKDADVVKAVYDYVAANIEKGIYKSIEISEGIYKDLKIKILPKDIADIISKVQDANKVTNDIADKIVAHVSEKKDINEAINFAKKLQGYKKLEEQGYDMNGLHNRIMDSINKKETNSKVLGEEADSFLKEKSFINTVIDSEKTTPELAKKTNDELDKYYTELSNEESLKRADSDIKKNILKVHNEVMEAQSLTADISVKAIRLIKQYENEGLWQEAVNMVEHISEMAKKAGQAIQALSLWNKLSPETIVKMSDKLMEDIHKRKISNNVKELIFKRMSEIKKMQEGDLRNEAFVELINYVADNIPPTLREKFSVYRYTNILSDMGSHLRNVYSNTLNIFLTRPLQMFGNSMADYVKNIHNPAAREYKFIDIPSYYKDAVVNIPHAFIAMKEAYKKGYVSERILDEGNIGGMIQTARRGKVLKKYAIPLRVMEAEDVFFSTLSAQAEKMRLMKTGLSDKEAYNKAKNIASELLLRNKELNPESQGTITRALQNIADGLNDLRNKKGLTGIATSFFFPFVMTPFRFAQFSVAHSPLGLIGADINRSNVVKATMGSVAMGAGAMLAMNDRTTWTAPEDKELRKLWYQSGRKPYSVLIGGKWVPLQYFGPFGLSIAIPAAIKHYFSDSEDVLSDSFGLKLANLTFGVGRSIVEMTPLNSVSDMFHILDGDVDYKVESTLGFMSKQFIPYSGSLKTVSKWYDRKYRKADDFFEAIEKDLPFLSTNLPTIKDAKYKDAEREWLDVTIKPYTTGTNDETYSVRTDSKLKTVQKKRKYNNKIKAIRDRLK